LGKLAGFIVDWVVSRWTSSIVGCLTSLDPLGSLGKLADFIIDWVVVALHAFFFAQTMQGQPIYGLHP
jgi:hypothetical protein